MPNQSSRWTDLLICIGAGLFILALAVSALFEPSIRVLHTLQAAIYVAVIVLTRRRSPWGYGAGFTIACFWNYTSLFVTTFIRNGVEQLFLLLHTGQLRRPDLLIAVVAAAGHFLLIAACLVGFLSTRPAARQWATFVAGGLLSIAYFVFIILIAGRQYVPLLHRIFHI